MKEGDFSDDYKEVILCPHLVSHDNVFKKIITCIKYIFGYKSKYGEWDNMIVTKENYLPLKRIVEFIER